MNWKKLKTFMRSERRRRFFVKCGIANTKLEELQEKRTCRFLNLTLSHDQMANGYADRYCLAASFIR